MPTYGNVKIYSSKELKKATRNFCSANKLGQGSFGCVYLVGLVAEIPRSLEISKSKHNNLLLYSILYALIIYSISRES
jgi:hypothetical protein